MDDADSVRAKGWRQGSILLTDSLPENCVFEPAVPPNPPGAIFLVLTQDCDLVQPDFDKEPFVELIRAQPVQSPDGTLLYGKNPRRIHFQIGGAPFEASCHERCRISRRLLASCEPSKVHVVDAHTLDLLREWVAKRYTRPAFPDEFNKRVKQPPHGKAIRKLLERKGHLFQDLYLCCDPRDGELPAGKTYQIMVWPTMTSAAHKDETLRKEALEACTKLEAALSKCPGIQVRECEVRHEGQITLDDLRYFAPWDFDDLTHRETLSP